MYEVTVVFKSGAKHSFFVDRAEIGQGFKWWDDDVRHLPKLMHLNLNDVVCITAVQVNSTSAPIPPARN